MTFDATKLMGGIIELLTLTKNQVGHDVEYTCYKTNEITHEIL